MKTNIFISACLIVKNEELLIENCLKSINNVVDEIIVLDTGSEDKTIEISTKYAHIYKTNWKNNFSLARNESIKYAKGKWILILDADETLSEYSQNNIIDFLKKQPNDIPLSFQFKIEAEKVKGNYLNNTDYFKSCLFSNNFDIYYSYPIHEQLFYKGKELKSIRLENFSIISHDIRKDKKALYDKNQFYINLLDNKSIEINKIQKCYYLFNSGLSFLELSQFENAYIKFSSAYNLYQNLKISKESELYIGILIELINYNIFIKKNYFEALNYVNELLDIKPIFPKALYFKGYILHFQENISEAIKYFDMGLNNIQNDEKLLIRLLCEKGRCLINLNNIKGISYFDKALKIDPNDNNTLIFLEKYHLLNKNLEKAIYYHLNLFDYSESQKSFLLKANKNSNNYKDIYNKLLLRLKDLKGWTNKERIELIIFHNKLNL